MELNRRYLMHSFRSMVWKQGNLWHGINSRVDRHKHIHSSLHRNGWYSYRQRQCHS